MSNAPSVARQAAVGLLAACLLMAALGTLYSWSVFVPAMEAHLGQSRAVVSLVFSAATLFFTIGMLLAPLLDDVGTPAWRGFAACLVGAAGVALAGLVDSIWLVMAGFGAIFGLANGIGYSLSLRLAQDASPQRRGLFTGIAVAGYTIGAAVGTPLLSASLEIWDYRTTLLLLAVYLAGAGALIYALIERAAPRRGGLHQSVDSSLARQPAAEFAVLWLYFFLNSLIGVSMIAHAAPMAASRGGSTAAIALAAVLVALGNGVGRLAGGWLTDRMPASAVLCGAPALNCLALAASALVPSVETILLSLFLVGAGYGCVASALPASIGKNYAVHQMSRIYGRLFSAWGAAGLLGPFLGGALFDIDGNYDAALAAAAAAALAAAALGAAGAPSARRERGRAWHRSIWH